VPGDLQCDPRAIAVNGERPDVELAPYDPDRFAAG
jgi:hypothetical protein